MSATFKSFTKWKHIEQSDWRCEMFASGAHGIVYIPPKGGEPCAFHRWMQRVILGHRWVKVKK